MSTTNPATGLEDSLLPVPRGRLMIDASTSIVSPIQLSLIIPTFQESATITPLLKQLITHLDAILPNAYELIVVDDNSPDHTWAIAQALTPQFPQIKVMCRHHEAGLSTAVIRGWQVAQGSILGVMDGDLQHPPDIVLTLLTAIRQGADLAIASRHVTGGGVSDWSFKRRLLSRGAQVLGLVLLPSVVGRVSDPMSGYFLVRRSAIAQHTLNPLGYKLLLEIIARGKIQRIQEVGYVFQERQDGQSKVTWRHYLHYLRHLLRLRLSTRSTTRRQLQFPLIRFFKFGLVGLSGVVVDMLLLYLLHDPSMLGLGLTRSKIIAAETAILNNFIWNDAWTFWDLAHHQRGWRSRGKRLLKFNLICLMGVVLNVLILNVLFNVLGVHYLVANLIAIAAVTLWNFWVNVKLNWRSTQVK